MRNLQNQLIYLNFLAIYGMMTVIKAVTVGEYLMGTISEFEVNTSYMTKPRSCDAVLY